MKALSSEFISEISKALQESEQKSFSDPNSVLLEFSCELKEMGFEFPTIYHAISYTKTHGAQVVPVAWKYYQKATERNERSYLLGWITKEVASSAVPALLRDFYAETNEQMRWAIADALYTLASKKYKKEYINIIANPEYGISRQMLVLLVGKLKIEEAIPTLVTLLDDDSVTAHALIALGKYKKPEFREYFERFIDSPNKLWRKEAKKALKKLPGT